jgi:drug/metabolite transporter (DMT)-like permease
MLWLLLASCTALCESLKDVGSKQSLKTIDEFIVTGATMWVGVAVLLPYIALTTGFPTIGPHFGGAILVGGSLNVVAFSLYIRAIKLGDLSLTVPLVTLTPLFLLVTSPLIVGEWASPIDAIGVLLIIIGSYILNLGAKPGEPNQPRAYLAPIRAMIHNPGSRLMLIVALIWSVTSTVDKIGVQNSSPLMWAASLFGFIGTALLPLGIQRWRRRDRSRSSLSRSSLSRSSLSRSSLSRREILTLGSAGIINAIGVGLQMVALTMAPVAQVIAVKRMSALITVVLGHFLFQEQGIKARLLGAAVMVAGVAVISIG